MRSLIALLMVAVLCACTPGEDVSLEEMAVEYGWDHYTMKVYDVGENREPIFDLDGACNIFSRMPTSPDGTPYSNPTNAPVFVHIGESLEKCQRRQAAFNVFFPSKSDAILYDYHFLVDYPGNWQECSFDRNSVMGCYKSRLFLAVVLPEVWAPYITEDHTDRKWKHVVIGHEAWHAISPYWPEHDVVNGKTKDHPLMCPH